MSALRVTEEWLQQYSTGKKPTKEPIEIRRAKDQSLEDLFRFQLRALPALLKSGCVGQYQFYEQRKWRFDFAWPDVYKIAVEIEGGSWINGAHNRGKKFQLDTEKYAIALIMGWRVLRLTGDQVKSGQGLIWLECLLGIRESPL